MGIRVERENMMLKHLDKWLDSLNEFESKHEDFCCVVKIIFSVVGVLAILITFGAGIVAVNHWNSALDAEITWEGDLQMSDSRIVHCIATGRGMSCDWTHVSGADNL